MDAKGKLSKGERTKSLILDKSLELFSESGFFDVSFQKIADECGISQTAILYHYKNKQDLLSGAIEHIIEHNRAYIYPTFDPSDNAYQRIYKHYLGHFKWCLNHPEEVQVMLLLYYFSSFEGEYKKIYLNLMNTINNRFQEYLYSGMREKIFDIEEDRIPDLAEALNEFLVGSLINFNSQNKTKELEEKIISKWERAVKIITCFNG